MAIATETAAGEPTAAFGPFLKQLRRDLGWSQLRLAVTSDVSQRHISFLESGRSRPSREMIHRLGETLDLPLRTRNRLFAAGGFTPGFPRTDWHSPTLEPLRSAVEAMVEAHDPHPAYVVDRCWNVMFANRASERLGRALSGTPGPPRRPDDRPPNLMRTVFDANGLRPCIEDWAAVASLLLRRVEREASGDAELGALARELRTLAGDDLSAAPLEAADLPVLPLTLKASGRRLRYFTAITTVGTPLDVTVQDLRVETLLPADAETAEFMRSLAGSEGQIA